ncbi:MAG: hypothetical protein JXO22_07965, partial [Phycisphaerae bacterium]|nr:hypothetical protein [Phycisphaerae bacterium]
MCRQSSVSRGFGRAGHGATATCFHFAIGMLIGGLMLAAVANADSVSTGGTLAITADSVVANAFTGTTIAPQISETTGAG